MSGLHSGRKYRIMHVGDNTYLSDGTGHEKWRLVQYGPYWTLQNTHTSQYLMTNNVRNPVGQDITVGPMQIGWQLTPRAEATTSLKAFTGLPFGPASTGGLLSCFIGPGVMLSSELLLVAIVRYGSSSRRE
ncbi:hypothetical protein BDP27DRAFT_1406258, partial [Rhodocollybia butyracea]